MSLLSSDPFFPFSGALQTELSTDLKTLTKTERSVGQSKPKSILVFDRE
jgi:hypothetical protein